MSTTAPLLATSRDGTTAVTGAGLLESVTDLIRGVESRNWVEAGLGGVSAGLDAFSITIDPIGTVAAWGFSWLIEHVAPLKQALDQLAGDPGQIEGHVQTWQGVARLLHGEQAGMDSAVRRLAERWIGSAATAAQQHGRQNADVLRAAAKVAEAMGIIVTGGALLVAVVRGLVRDLIAQCLSTLAVRLPAWIAEAGVTIGTATPLIVAQAQALVAQFAKKIFALLRSLTASLRRLGTHITHLGELVQDIRAAIRKTHAASSARRAAAAAGIPPRITSGPRMQTTGLNAKYTGENLPGNAVWATQVHYLTATEREQYRVFVRDGKLYDVHGNPFDTSNARSGSMPRSSAIFVVDEHGNIYASNYQEVGKFHHSSLLGGQPVAGAGEIKVTDGVIERISDRSGHYRPGREYTQRVLELLRRQGIHLNPDQIKISAP